MPIHSCILDTLAPAMQSHHNCETNVDWDSRSSNSDTETGSDNEPSPPSSDIDPNTAVPRTPSPDGSPVHVSIGDWSPVSSTTSPSGKGNTRLQVAGTERTLVAEAIPEGFWDLLKKLGMYNRKVHDLMDEIWLLRQECLEAKPGMFVRKDIHGTSLTAYMQLCDILSLAGYEESQGILRRWGMFLRHLCVEFWPHEDKMVVSAPNQHLPVADNVAWAIKMLFLKLKVFPLHPPALPNVSNINADVVRLQLVGKVLNVQDVWDPKTIILVEEGYSAAEFLYTAQKISYILDALPHLSGIFLSLVTVAPDGGSAGQVYRFEVDMAQMNVPSVQVAFIFYDKANFKDFERRARSARGIEDWEKDNPHFMRVPGWAPASGKSALLFKSFPRQVHQKFCF